MSCSSTTSDSEADSVAFTPVHLRSLILPNRFIKAATHDGSTIDAKVETYCRLARNGVSLLTVAYMSIDPINKTFDTQHHIDNLNVTEWKDLVDRVGKAGAKLSAQLHHPGLFTMSSSGQPMGPSLFFLPSKLAWPHVLTELDLAKLKEQYVTAARLCVHAGFAAIELHCGHGYLLSQFLTPMINRRSDGYGGSLVSDRARFPSEVITAIRNAIPETMPLLVKMNVDDGLPFGGLAIEDSLCAARLFVDAGADAIVPSYGYTSLNGFGMLRGDVPLNQMAAAMPHAFTQWLVRVLGRFLVPTIPYSSLFMKAAVGQYVEALHPRAKVIYVGGCDSLDAAEEVLNMGCDAVQIGRPLIREPWFVRKLEVCSKQRTSLGLDLASVRQNSKSLCIRCNHCTLASIDPDKFSGKCPYIEDKEGIQFERDIEELY